jgi:RPA family protein
VTVGNRATQVEKAIHPRVKDTLPDVNRPSRHATTIVSSNRLSTKVTKIGRQKKFRFPASKRLTSVRPEIVSQTEQVSSNMLPLNHFWSTAQERSNPSKISATPTKQTHTRPPGYAVAAIIKQIIHKEV